MTSFLPSPHPFFPPFLFFHSFSPKVNQPKQIVGGSPVQGVHSSRVSVTAQRTELEWGGWPAVSAQAVHDDGLWERGTGAEQKATQQVSRLGTDQLSDYLEDTGSRFLTDGEVQIKRNVRINPLLLDYNWNYRCKFYVNTYIHISTTCVLFTKTYSIYECWEDGNTTPKTKNAWILIVKK